MMLANTVNSPVVEVISISKTSNGLDRAVLSWGVFEFYLDQQQVLTHYAGLKPENKYVLTASISNDQYGYDPELYIQAFSLVYLDDTFDNLVDRVIHLIELQDSWFMRRLKEEVHIVYAAL